MPRQLAGEDGVVTGTVAVIALALLAAAALAFDGGALIETHSAARGTATAAARAAAQELSTASLHDGTVRLDTELATAAADTLLDAAGVTGTVQITGDSVTVTVHTTHRMRLLPLADRHITATATATALSDVLATTP